MGARDAYEQLVSSNANAGATTAASHGATAAYNHVVLGNAPESYAQPTSALETRIPEAQKKAYTDNFRNTQSHKWTDFYYEMTEGISNNIVKSNFTDVQQLINDYKTVADKWGEASGKQSDILRMNPYEAAGLSIYQGEIDEYQRQMEEIQKELEKYGITVNGTQVDASRYNKEYFDSIKGYAVGASTDYNPVNGLLKYNTTLNVEKYLSHIGEEEMRMYNYLAANEPEKAEVYRQYLDSLVQQRLGGARAEEILDKYTASGRAVSRGTEAFKAGLSETYNAAVATLSGRDKATSASEYAAEQLRADLQSKGNEWWRTAGFDAMQSIGGMTPGLIAGAVNPTAGMAVFGATSGMMGYQEKLAEGWSKEDARSYGILVGASEAALSKALGGIPALGGAEGGVLAKLTKNLDNVYAKIILNRVGEMGSEALEEGLQTLIEPAIVSAIKGTPYDTPELREVLYSAALGAITSAGFGAPTAVAQSVDAASAYDGRYGVNAQTLVNEAKQIKDGSKAVVNQAQKKLDEGKRISNATAEKLTTTVNRGRMVDAVEAQINERTEDLSPQVARSLANAVVAKSRGEKLTTNQKKLIETNKDIAAELAKELNPKKPADWAKRVGMRGADARAYGDRTMVDMAEQIDQAILNSGEYSDTRANLMEKGQDVVGYTNDFDKMAEVYGNTTNYDSFEAAWEAAQKQGSTLTETQAIAAYDAGKAKLSATEYKPTLKQRGTGAVSFAAVRDGNTQYEAPSEDETRVFKKSARYQYLSELAKRLKVDIVFFKAGAEGINGKYVNGTVYLAVDASPSKYNSAEGYVMMTAAHELTHYIKEASPARYAELKDFVTKHIIDKGKMDGKTLNDLIDAKRVAYYDAGVELSVEGAIEEIVADACEMMLRDNTLAAQLKGENQTLHGMVSKWMKKFLKTVKDAFKTASGSQLEAYHAEAKAMEDVFDELQRIWNLGLTEATQIEIGDIDLSDVAAATDVDGHPLLQIKAMEADMDTYRTMLTDYGKMSETEIDNLFKTINDAVDIISENLEALDYAWEEDIDSRAFTPVKPNSDKLYQVSVDFSTLCRKRILQQSVANRLQAELGRAVTREEGIAIRNALLAVQAEGRQIEVACALCYVESARMKSPKQIQKFLDNREAVVRDFFAGKDKELMKARQKEAELAVRKKHGVPADKSLKQLNSNIAKEIRQAKRDARSAYQLTAEEQRLIEVAKGMSISDFTTPEGLADLKKNYPRLYDAYTSYIRNATKSKGVEGDTWWRAGDSQSIGNALIEAMNNENGLRSQSWSDFQVIHLMDYIAATIELSTRGAKEQVYTKVPDFVDLMGKTGAMINLSLIPTKEYSGKLEYDPVEGMPYAEATRLRDKYPETVGTICIGIDDQQIRDLLADKTIDYVIPYHKSGMAANVRTLMGIPNWKEFELFQTESNLNRREAEVQAAKYGVELLAENDKNYHKAPKFSDWFNVETAKATAKANAGADVLAGGYAAMQEAAENYLKLCAERGLAPKFSKGMGDFSMEENYWKLLIDRKMINHVTGGIIEQQAIRPVFDRTEVLRILNDELDRYETVREDQDYAFNKVTDAFKAGQVRPGMSVEEIAKAMQTPVDNVTEVNIIAGARDMSGGKASVKDYWRPNLNQAEWKLLNRTMDAEIRNNSKYLDDATKWLYAKSDNAEVFALYGIGDGTEPTPLYVSKGKKANAETKRLLEYIREERDGAYDSGETFASWTEAVSAAKREYDARNDAHGHRGKALELDDILDKLSVRDRRRDTERGVQNSSDIKLSIKDEAMSDRMLLANTLMTAAQNDGERRRLNNYKAQMDKFEDIQQQLNEAELELSRVIRIGAKKDIADARRKRDGLMQQLIRADSKLVELQATKPLKDLMQRVKEDTKNTVEQRGRDRLEAVKEREAQKRKDAVNKVRSQKNERIAEIRQEEKQKRQAAVAKERAKADKRVAGVIDYYRDMKQRGIDSRSRTAIRKKIKDLHAQMSSRLLNPKENRYIPKPLLKTVAEILDEVNLDSGRSVKLKAKMMELSAEYKKIAQSNEYGFAFDSVVADMIDQLQQMLLNMDDTSIYNMTKAELEMVYNTMKALDHTVRTAVKLVGYESEKNIFELSRSMVNEIERATPINSKWLEKYIDATARADVFFKRLGGYHKDSTWAMLGDMLNEAQRKQIQIQMEAAAIFEELMQDEDAFAAMTDYRNLIDIGLENANGEPVLVTKDIALKIYMDTMAEDNARHFMYSGYTVPNLKEYYKGKPSEAFNKGSVRVHGFGARLQDLRYKERHAETEQEAADIQQAIEKLDADAANWLETVRNSIYDQMGEYELEWVKAAEKFFNSYSQKVLNETTMAVYGFEKATVPYYVPIHTDSAYRQANFESITRDLNLENSGFMKTRLEGARNPMLAEGLVDVVNGQIGKVAKYAAMMPAVRNFQKVYGKSSSGFENSVQNAVRTKFGGDAVKYIENLLTDLTSPRRGEGALGELADKLRGNLAKAALSLNVGSAVEQVTSYPKAAVIVGYKPLIKALKDVKSNPRFDAEVREEIAKWTPLMWQRTRGHIDRDINSLREAQNLQGKAEKKLDFLYNWISVVEGATVGQLWYAAQYYVEDTTNLQRGTDEFMRETAKVFNRIVEQTQASYNTMQRPDILRNPNALVKQMTMFMTERLQNANMIIDAVGTYNAYRKDFDKGVGDVTEQDVKEARDVLVRTSSSLIAGAAASVALRLLANALLYNMKGYRDEEDELTVVSVSGQLVENFFESLASTFLWGAEVYDVMHSVVTGDTYYGISLSGVENFTDALNAMVKAAQEPTKESLWKASKTAMTMLGVPVNNANKLINALVYRIKDAAQGNGFWDFESEVKMTDERRAKLLYEAAVNGNDKKLEKLFESYGTEADADAALAKHIKQLFKTGELSAEEAIEQLKEFASMSEYDASLVISKLGFELEQGFAYDEIQEKFVTGEITEANAVSFLEDYGDVEDAEKTVTQWRMEKETGLKYDKIKDYLAAEDITKQQAIDYRMKYGGQSLEDATVMVTKWMGEIETGIPYDKVEQYFRDGKITYEELASYYMKYWSYDEEKAVQVADKIVFVGDDTRLADATLAAVSGYIAYCDEAEVDKFTYLTAYQTCYDIRADKDKNGKSISGSALKKKLVYIDGLNLAPYQKTAVAKAIGITDKQLDKYNAPWL